MPTSIDWYGTSLVSGSQLGGLIGQGGVLGMPRSDGLVDNFDAIQGVRTYDSTSSTWTTPDAYAGEANDPASQKSYMWNNNNPVSYNDPTGYDVWLGATYTKILNFLHTFVEITSATNDIVYEAGNTWGESPVGRLTRQRYGDNINPMISRNTNLATPVLIPPPAGMTQKQWDRRVDIAFQNLSNALDARGVAYTDVAYPMINSNTYTAEGLHLAGLSYKQAENAENQVGNTAGSGELSMWLLEGELWGTGYDYTVIAGGGAGSNGVPGASDPPGRPL